jgi:hypothetical protein
MKKIIIALGIALASSTAALAQSSALDVVGQKFEVNASAVDYAATASIGSAPTEMRDRLGDGSPMIVDGLATPVAIETGYLPGDRLGGNS